jgi:hypothetical protein
MTETKPQNGMARGTLLLADISGYTAFLQAVGGAHAADMAAGTFVPTAYPLLTSLLDGIIEQVAPPFTLSKVEGDAVFAFADEDGALPRGSELLGCLTGCYQSFRSRLDEARTLMLCDCDACSSIDGLDLKFVLHHGEYVVQPVAGRPELLGPDVTIAHLLLKNHVADLLGRSAYALVTERAAAELAVPLERSVQITERYDHYPPVQARVLVLGPGD